MICLRSKPSKGQTSKHQKSRVKQRKREGGRVRKREGERERERKEVRCALHPRREQVSSVKSSPSIALTVSKSGSRTVFSSQGLAGQML